MNLTAESIEPPSRDPFPCTPENTTPPPPLPYFPQHQTPPWPSCSWRINTPPQTSGTVTSPFPFPFPPATILTIIYRNGRFRSIYFYNPSHSPASLSGELKCDVHYYEDGNVRLTTSKSILSTPPSSSSSTLAIAIEITKTIAATENTYQEELNRGFLKLSEGEFKGLRRQLPITRQKVEWEKIGGYRVSPSLLFFCSPHLSQIRTRKLWKPLFQLTLSIQHSWAKISAVDEQDKSKPEKGDAHREQNLLISFLRQR